MSGRDEHTPAERRVLDLLEQEASDSSAEASNAVRRKRIRRGVVAVMAGVCLVAVAAVLLTDVMPDDSVFGVDSAVGSLPEVAADQRSPEPSEFVEARTVSRALTKSISTLDSPPGVRSRQLFVTETSNHSWLSMGEAGLVRARTALRGPYGRVPGKNSQTSVRAEPAYWIAGRRFGTSEMLSLTDRPDALVALIAPSLQKIAPEHRTLASWEAYTSALKAISTPLPAIMRARLIQALEELPRVTQHELAPDAKGVAAVEFRLAHDGLLRKAVFHPENAQLTYLETKVVEPGAGKFKTSRAGQVEDSYRLISVRIVPSPPPDAERMKYAD